MGSLVWTDKGELGGPRYCFSQASHGRDTRLPTSLVLCLPAEKRFFMSIKAGVYANLSVVDTQTEEVQVDSKLTSSLYILSI